MHIHEAPHGINLVVETPETLYIGRFDNTDGFQVLMHDCSIHTVDESTDTEEIVKTAAKYGVAVDQRDVMFDAAQVSRVRILGEISKE